ncbi:MAG: hypothetical protein ABI540_04120 [Spartobacteria bacterium]
MIGRFAGARRGNGTSLGEGGGFGGRFSFWPSDFLALAEGLGPRTFGFFMAMDLPFSTSRRGVNVCWWLNLSHSGVFLEGGAE